MNPINIILEMAVQQLEKLTISKNIFELTETIEESNLPGLNDWALVMMLNQYETDYEKNPTMKRLFGIPFKIAVFLYRTNPAFRRRMNWVFTTLAVYFLNYRFYTEKSLMPKRWDMTDEQIQEDIKNEGY